MGEDPLITVVTPCLNAARFITDCLDSVASSGRELARHIVVDGGSTDGTVEMLAARARSDPRLEYSSGRDKGLADALNKGVSKVATPWFMWLSADDRLLPHGLELLADRASSLCVQNRRASIIYGDYQGIDAEGRILKWRPQPSFDRWDCIHCYLTVQISSAIFNTELTRQAGNFDENLQFAMDYDLVLKLSALAPVEHVRGYVGQFRFHSAAKTATQGEICERETRLVRRRFSSGPDWWVRAKSRLSRARVALRMLREGCLGARVWR